MPAKRRSRRVKQPNKEVPAHIYESTQDHTGNSSDSDTALALAHGAKPSPQTPAAYATQSTVVVNQGSCATASGNDSTRASTLPRESSHPAAQEEVSTRRDEADSHDSTGNGQPSPEVEATFEREEARHDAQERLQGSEDSPPSERTLHAVQSVDSQESPIVAHSQAETAQAGCDTVPCTLPTTINTAEQLQSAIQTILSRRTLTGPRCVLTLTPLGSSVAFYASPPQWQTYVHHAVGLPPTPRSLTTFDEDHLVSLLFRTGQVLETRLLRSLKAKDRKERSILRHAFRSQIQRTSRPEFIHEFMHLVVADRMAWALGETPMEDDRPLPVPHMDPGEWAELAKHHRIFDLLFHWDITLRDFLTIWHRYRPNAAPIASPDPLESETDPDLEPRDTPASDLNLQVSTGIGLRSPSPTASESSSHGALQPFNLSSESATSTSIQGRNVIVTLVGGIDDTENRMRIAKVENNFCQAALALFALAQRESMRDPTVPNYSPKTLVEILINEFPNLPATMRNMDDITLLRPLYISVCISPLCLLTSLNHKGSGLHRLTLNDLLTSMRLIALQPHTPRRDVEKSLLRLIVGMAVQGREGFYPSMQSAIDYWHDRGIVHGTTTLIKPEEIKPVVIKQLWEHQKQSNPLSLQLVEVMTLSIEEPGADTRNVTLVDLTEDEGQRWLEESVRNLPKIKVELQARNQIRDTRKGKYRRQGIKKLADMNSQTVEATTNGPAAPMVTIEDFAYRDASDFTSTAEVVHPEAIKDYDFDFEDGSETSAGAPETEARSDEDMDGYQQDDDNNEVTGAGASLPLSESNVQREVRENRATTPAKASRKTVPTKRPHNNDDASSTSGLARKLRSDTGTRPARAPDNAVCITEEVVDDRAPAAVNESADADEPMQVDEPVADNDNIYDGMDVDGCVAVGDGDPELPDDKDEDARGETADEEDAQGDKDEDARAETADEEDAQGDKDEDARGETADEEDAQGDMDIDEGAQGDVEGEGPEEDEVATGENTGEGAESEDNQDTNNGNDAVDIFTERVLRPRQTRRKRHAKGNASPNTIICRPTRSRSKVLSRRYIEVGSEDDEISNQGDGNQTRSQSRRQESRVRFQDLEGGSSTPPQHPSTLEQVQEDPPSDDDSISLIHGLTSLFESEPVVAFTKTIPITVWRPLPNLKDTVRLAANSPENTTSLSQANLHETEGSESDLTDFEEMYGQENFVEETLHVPFWPAMNRLEYEKIMKYQAPPAKPAAEDESVLRTVSRAHWNAFSSREKNDMLHIGPIHIVGGRLDAPHGITGMHDPKLKNLVSLDAARQCRDWTITRGARAPEVSVTRRVTIREFIRDVEERKRTGRMLRCCNVLDIPIHHNCLPLELDHFSKYVYEDFPTWKPRTNLDLTSLASQWALAAHSGAYSRLHTDAAGLATHVCLLEGKKAWWIARRCNFWGDEQGFDPRKSLFDCAVLSPGDELIMPPGTVHAVLTLQDSLALGGHFYNFGTMESTAISLIREHYFGQYLTNTEHPKAPLLLMKGFMALMNSDYDSKTSLDESEPDLRQLAILMSTLFNLDELNPQIPVESGKHCWQITSKFEHDYKTICEHIVEFVQAHRPPPSSETAFLEAVKKVEEELVQTVRLFEVRCYRGLKWKSILDYLN
ncbi:hypothetical protein ACEPAF_7597 [Sanghuangporus sanghuang]